MTIDCPVALSTNTCVNVPYADAMWLVSRNIPTPYSTERLPIRLTRIPALIVDGNLIGLKYWQLDATIKPTIGDVAISSPPFSMRKELQTVSKYV